MRSSPLARALVVAAVLAGGALACGDPSRPPEPPVTPVQPAPKPEILSVVTSNGTSQAIVDVGDTIRIIAKAYDASRVEIVGPAPQFRVDSAHIATITPDGTVVARAPGLTNIWARFGDKETYFVFIARAPYRNAIRVTPAGATLAAAGDTVRLRATAYDAVGWPTRDVAVDWTTRDTLFARVDRTGLVTAQRRGLTHVVATFGALRDSVSVGIAGTPTIAAVHVWPDTNRLFPGMARQLVAREIVADGAARAIAGAAWSSTDPRVAEVDGAGRVTAVAPGRTTVVATTPTARVSAEVVVSDGAPLRFAMVATSTVHSCGLTTAGEAYCWGSNENGELGTLAPTDRCERVSFDFRTGRTSRALYACALVPTRVTTELRFATLTIWGANTCALTASGAAYCWGPAAGAGAGRGAGWHAVPTAIAPGIAFREIVPGGCGLAVDGLVYCWGVESEGRLGRGPSSSPIPTALLPAPVAGGQRFVALGHGGSHECAATAAGVAYCWGRGNSGELGTTDLTVAPGCGTICSPAPVAVRTDVPFARLAGGPQFSCGLTPEGRAYCWGAGAGATPTPVATSALFRELVAADNHACGRTADGAFHCWEPRVVIGEAPYTARQPFPGLALRTVRLAGASSFDRVPGRDACGIGVDGLAYCWGLPSAGRLGTGEPPPELPARVAPVLVAGQR